MTYFFVILFHAHPRNGCRIRSTSIGIPILSLVLGTELSVNLMATTGLFLCLVIFVTQIRKPDRAN